MSTTLPPPSVRPATAPAGPAPRPPASQRGRWAAFGALAAISLIVAYLVLSASSGATYHLLFTDASQLVVGDQVQVGGVPVGRITAISLTDDNLAEVTIDVDSSIAPLHAGTTAQIRSPSLAGIANRYIALTPGKNSNATLPDGATLPVTATASAVDLDEVLDALDAPTRVALQQIIDGSAAQYAGASRQIDESIPYFSPTLSAADHILAQLDLDQPAFAQFVAATSNTVSAIAARAPQLGALVGAADQTFGVVGAQSDSLQRGLRELPLTLNQGNRTLADLDPTLDALTRLVDAAKPNTTSLAGLLRALTPLLAEADGPVRELGLAVSRPGPSNDLTDLARALPGLRNELAHATPDGITALTAAEPIAAFITPYAPDLVGAARAFGESSSYFDADGHYARISPVFADFAPAGENTLSPVNPLAGLSRLQSGQTDRCPGAAAAPAPDGSAPFGDDGLAACDPSEVPGG